jgi:hypothetical protein
MNAIPHPPRRDREHSTELTASENSDRLAGENHVSTTDADIAVRSQTNIDTIE